MRISNKSSNGCAYESIAKPFLRASTFILPVAALAFLLFRQAPVSLDIQVPELEKPTTNNDDNHHQEGEVAQLQSNEMTSWINANPHTPGARFISLLRTHIHYEIGAEDERIQACHNRNDRSQCYATIQHAHKKTPNTTIIPTTNTLTLGQLTHLNHGRDMIPSLGTHTVCLVLILAGQAVQDSGIIVEFGPFAGMSSRCMAVGLNKTGIDNLLYSFDKFDHEMNWDAIVKQAPWVTKEAEYDPKESFEWVWNRVVQSVYPSAQCVRGMISEETANSKVWNDQPIAMLSLDSIKNIEGWKSQLAGISTIKKGTILSLLDFRLTDQPALVYGCWRQEYLIPVFNLWDFWESWLFVVKKDFDMAVPCECLLSSDEDGITKMETLLRSDLDLMGDASMVETKNKTFTKTADKWRAKGAKYLKGLAKLADCPGSV